ncbi:MAG: hypothetical protein ACM32E_07910 [Gemmatimonadota bacterium]
MLRRAAARLSEAAAGLITAASCAAVGSAIAALCNPPIVRRVALAALSTASAVIAALVAGISPANAAIRAAAATGQPHSGTWLPGAPLLAALALAAASWALSAALAARRGPAPPAGEG